MTRQEMFEAVCEKRGLDAEEVFSEIKDDFAYGKDGDMEDFGEFCDAEDLSIATDESSIEEWLDNEGYLS